MKEHPHQNVFDEKKNGSVGVIFYFEILVPTPHNKSLAYTAIEHELDMKDQDSRAMDTDHIVETTRHS